MIKQIGGRQRAVPALCRYLEAEGDEVAAAVAAEALGRLKGPQAELAVKRARERFGESGPFGRRAAVAMSETASDQAALDVPGLLARSNPDNS